jgi:D-alanine-D-alanine ligase-like ATP-grasp enzyme
MELKYEKLGYGFSRLSNDKAATIVRDSLVRLDDFLVFKLSSNKVAVHHLLAEQMLPIPEFTISKTLAVPEKAENILRNGKSLVCKPAYGSGGGLGVITGIHSSTELKRALKRTLSVCDTALIEEFVVGNSYRLLFLDGVLLDAVHRKPPVVIGDGIKSIRQLIKVENEYRLRADPCVALSLLTADAEMRLTLGSAGLTFGSIPSIGAVIEVKSVVNENNAEGNVRVSENVHPSVLELCRTAVSSLKIRFCGVDLIAEDISRPVDEQKLVINEVNCLPGLHHHYLVSKQSPSVCVATAVIQAVLAES